MKENMDGILTVFISRHFIPLHILVVKPPPAGPYLGPGKQNQVNGRKSWQIQQGMPSPISSSVYLFVSDVILKTPQCHRRK